MNTEFKIIVCPNDEKIKILENLNKNSELYNVKFMSKEEFIKNYFFDYTVDTIYYLMDKYKFNLDVCKVYLKNMLVIDVSKEYESVQKDYEEKESTYDDLEDRIYTIMTSKELTTDQKMSELDMLVDSPEMAKKYILKYEDKLTEEV